MKKMSLKKVVLTLSACALVAAPAFAANWILIGDGHYIDAHSIKPSTEYGTYTMTTEYLSRNGEPLEIINGKEIYSIRTNSFVDCRTNFAKTISYVASDKNKKTVITGNNVGKHWYGVNNPGSRAYESYEFVCTDRYLNHYRGYHRNLWWY